MNIVTLADVCKVSIRFAVRMCKLERCRKATGSDTSLVDFDSVSFLVLQQHFICDHSGLAYLRRKHNVRIAMHTYICHRTQKIEKRKLCVRPTVRFDFSARKDNTILNTAHMNLVQETANEAMSFFQADQEIRFRPGRSCVRWIKNGLCLTLNFGTQENRVLSFVPCWAP